MFFGESLCPASTKLLSKGMSSDVRRKDVGKDVRGVETEPIRNGGLRYHHVKMKTSFLPVFSGEWLAGQSRIALLAVPQKLRRSAALLMKRKNKSSSPKTKIVKAAAEEVKLSGMAAFKVHAWEYGKAIILALVLALMIRSFVVQAFHIPSSSMVPTFLEGDRVLVTKFSYGVRNPFTNSVWFGQGKPQRGDVVIFKYPEEPGTDFVKRVVGLPGETLEVIEGRIMIDGQGIDDPHGHYDNPYPVGSRNFGPVVVPDNKYFMMGDNRDFSNDSRSWGFVDSSFLRGKAWRLYWSWNSTRGLSFFQRLRLNRLGMKIE
jgi:signal peptidase I